MSPFTLLSRRAMVVRWQPIPGWSCRRRRAVRLSSALVAERSSGASCGSVAGVAGLVEFSDPDIVLDALFASVRPVATRITIVGRATVVVERSTDDHLQGIALESEATRLLLLVGARTGQLAALLARLERRVERLEWIGNGLDTLSDSTRR